MDDSWFTVLVIMGIACTLIALIGVAVAQGERSAKKRATEAARSDLPPPRALSLEELAHMYRQPPYSGTSEAPELHSGLVLPFERRQPIAKLSPDSEQAATSDSTPPI